MDEAQAEFRYHCPVVEAIVEDGRVRGVITESKSGRQAMLARVVIDASGDGDVAARAGVPYHVGRESDQLCQPMTMMFEISGFESLGGTPAADLKIHDFYDQLVEAIDRHQLDIELPYGEHRFGAPAFITLPGHRVAALQCTHVYKVDATDVRAVTRATVEARRQVHRIFLEALRRSPGLEHIRLNQTAAAIGVRECRHLEGRYRLELADLLEARRFDDAVTSVNFNIDVHEVDPHAEQPSMPKLPERMAHAKVPMCDIPYRCLVPREVGGLLFAGRCLSGSHYAHAAYRVTGTCMATGQAVGLAAAQAAARDSEPADVDGAALHRALVDRGVVILPRDDQPYPPCDHDPPRDRPGASG
jgi:hypothetical protein